MPHEIDIFVGTMIRQTRRLRGMSQKQLANEIGIRFQQVQKYEAGTNRVSASRLWQIANALEVPLVKLFPAEDGPEAVPTELAPAETRLLLAYRGCDNAGQNAINRVVEGVNALLPAPVE
ncbi:helix-turn-helix domain-containing protein [Phaeobacter italicus]|uniref:helix-turn-helix domain-containing protein n=1 Tax=Phaeobacter italicus TaxID=481446 RepID=UPI001C93EE95|nr:helix-turn-helix transcriptional regulator [Phaeobacter italicus]MBY6044395.1 helix-turn-helix domain-containing protein [Phaeobacter italicus]